MLTFPDVALVRERSAAAVYLAVGSTRFWVSDAAEFAALGFVQAKIRVVEDGVLSALREARLHAPPVTRPSDVFFDCGNDFDSVTGRWHFNCHASGSIVRRDVLVAGWLERRADETTAPWVNRAEHGIEDVFFNIVLDARFVERMYGPGGLSDALIPAVYPGNPARPPGQGALPFAALPATASSPQPSVTFDSWVLPQQGWNLHVELNAWHRDDTGALFSRHFVGRGAPPVHWVNPFGDDPGAFFPFNPLDPDGSGSLRAGDYVLMRGTLWQDHSHRGTNPPGPFDRGAFEGHGGWLEMHPPDWVVRIDAGPGANARRTCKWTALMTADRTGAGVSYADQVFPDFAPAPPSRYLEVRAVAVNTDARFTLAESVRLLQATDRTDHVDIAVTAAPTGFVQGRYKGSWTVDWRERDCGDEVWVDDATPAGAALNGWKEGWDWTADAPKPFAGSRLHRSALVAGEMHQHYFQLAAGGWQVGPGDFLFTMVWLDPEQPPDQVMLQWHSGTWDHRAYWGASRIDWGVEGAASRCRIGDLPRSGEWVRLEVPASRVGLSNAPVAGVAFTLWGGRAAWDHSGKRVVLPPPRQEMRVAIEPRPPVLGRPTVIVVRASAAAGGAAVAGQVTVNGQDLGPTNTPLNTTLRSSRKRVGGEWVVTYPLVAVRAAGFVSATVDCGWVEV